MPHFWIALPVNPHAKKLKEKLQSAAKTNNARILGDEVFFKPDERDTGYATIECDERQIETIADELNARFEHVLTAEEADRDEADYAD
jgi:hypothetical protein